MVTEREAGGGRPGRGHGRGTRWGHDGGCGRGHQRARAPTHSRKKLRRPGLRTDSCGEGSARVLWSLGVAERVGPGPKPLWLEGGLCGAPGAPAARTGPSRCPGGVSAPQSLTCVRSLVAGARPRSQPVRGSSNLDASQRTFCYRRSHFLGRTEAETSRVYLDPMSPMPPGAARGGRRGGGRPSQGAAAPQPPTAEIRASDPALEPQGLSVSGASASRERRPRPECALRRAALQTQGDRARGRPPPAP